MYSMGKFADKVQLSADTLRYYEKLKLIVPARTESNRRIFSEDDVKWIEFIKRLKSTGMPIKQIVSYSELRVKGDPTIAERINLMNDQKQLLLDKRNEIDGHLMFLDNKLEIYNKMQEDIKRSSKN